MRVHCACMRRKLRNPFVSYRPALKLQPYPSPFPSLYFFLLSPAELSLYELHRKPHEMVTDSTVVAVSPRALRSELMCPICLDLMKNPLTTKEVGRMAVHAAR